MVNKVPIALIFSLILIISYLPRAHAVSQSVQVDGIARGGSVFDYNCNCFVATPASLSTTRMNDVIVVVAQCAVFTTSCNDNITSLSDSVGHVWTLRAAFTPSGGRPIWEYYTVAASPVFSDQINASWSGSDSFGFVAFAVSGADILHPWTGPPMEQSSGSGCGSACGTITIPTFAAQDFVMVSVASDEGPPCGNSFADIAPFNAALVGGGGEVNYFITEPAASNTVSFTCTSYGDAVTLLGDALRSQSAPTLALDGVGIPTGEFSQMLTTTKGNDVILLTVDSDCNFPIYIKDTNSLSFGQRFSYKPPTQAFCLSEYYAIAHSPLVSDNITVVAPFTEVLAITGADTKTVFDPNPSNPTGVTCTGSWSSGLTCGNCAVGQGTCTASIQTSTIDFVIATTAIGDAPPCGVVYPSSVVPGFTDIVANGKFEVDYEITNLPQTTVVFNCSGTDVGAIVLDAISLHGTIAAS